MLFKFPQEESIINNFVCLHPFVQVVDPILLSCRLVDSNSATLDPLVSFPESITSAFDSPLALDPDKTAFVTMGMFTVVQIERAVQMLVPVYDFCIPAKECVNTYDDPCELFKKIRFPVNEFFPPKLSDLSSDDTTPSACQR